MSRCPVRPTYGAVLAVALAVACGEDNPLRHVTFGFSAAGYLRDPSGPPVVHTRLGWDVTLASAQVSIGPIYLHNTAPMVGTDMEQGRVVAEVLDTFTVDVLNPTPEVIPIGGNGTTEPVLSAEVRMAEAVDGPIAIAAGPGVAVAHFAGVATRAGVSIQFDGTLTLPMDSGAGAYAAFIDHIVSNIPFSFTAGQGGTLTLRVDPTHWFDFVDFGSLGPVGTPVQSFASPAAQAEVTPGIVSSNAVYLFSWTPGA